MREYFRPWKLVTFALGISWLYYGALNCDIPDWDVGVSTLMGVFTYLTAPWCARVIMQLRGLWWPLASFWYWFCVDGLYMAWHGLVGNQTFREANFWASSTLFWLCAFIWLHRGTLRELFVERRLVI